MIIVYFLLIIIIIIILIYLRILRMAIGIAINPSSRAIAIKDAKTML